MTGRTEFAGPSERIDLVLRRVIDELRQQPGFARITIVTPTNQASFFLKRSLAKGGLFNVDFKRLEDVAEQLVGQASGKKNLHDLQASEFVFEVARDGDRSLDSRLGGNDVSPQLQSALHSTFRELELLNDEQRAALAAKNEVQRELVARFDKYIGLANDYRHGSEDAREAAKIVEQNDVSVSPLGTVVLVEAAPVVPVQRPLFEALAALPDSITITISETPTDVVEPGPDPGTGNGKGTPVQPQRLNPVSVPDVAEEVREVVRGIIGLARRGIRFPKIAVVFEDDSYAARIGEALELAKIPVSGPDRTALSDAPEGQFITGLLDIFENDFTRLDLTAWLSTAPVKDPQTNLSVPASRWDAVSRTAGVTSSVEDSWVPRLTQYSKNVVVRARRSERLDEGRANEVEAAESDASFAVALRNFVTSLSKRKPGGDELTWSDFGSWLKSMTADYLSITDSDAAEARRTRLTRLIDRLEALESPGKAPGYAHCAGVLREQLDRRSAGLRSLGSGVYVGPVWTAAGCPFDTVFVLGMTEMRYPGTGFSDPLLPDPFKREIDADGNLLRTIERGIEDSHFSFNSVLASAKTIYMYWPRGVPGESREFGPARWFLDAARIVANEPLLQAGTLATSPVEGVVIRRRSDSLTMPASQAGDEREYDLLGARNWKHAENDAAEFPLSGELPSIGDSVKFASKQSGEIWSEYDGKIDLADLESELGETVGSATAFETYAACPYRYFLSRRLHIEPTESPEPELALDALTFGTLIHDVLEKFALWRMGFGSGGDGPETTENTPGRSEQEAWIRGAIADRIAVLKDETPGRSDGAWRIEQSRAWLILRQWLRREPKAAEQPDMRQIEAEYGFGGSGSPDSTSGPAVEVRTSSGKSVKFRGQVDRVDISDDGDRIIVYDYKSGGVSAYSKLDSDPVKKGTKLQLPLYSKAVAHKYPEADISASYWFVRESGSNELKPGPQKYQHDLAESSLEAAVETIVEGIDNGVFPARPGGSASWGDSNESFENCLFCEYARVCPRSKARLWDAKKNSDPALKDYLELAEDAT